MTLDPVFGIIPYCDIDIINIEISDQWATRAWWCFIYDGDVISERERSDLSRRWWRHSQLGAMIISYCYAENVISINTVQPVAQQTRPCLHLNPTNWNVFQLEETLKLFISSARFTFFFSKWKPFTEKLRSEEMCVYIEPYSVSVCILGPHPLLSCITYQGEYLIIWQICTEY